MPGSDGGNERVLSARLDNVRLLVDALSCINSSSRRSLDVLLTVPEQGGLKFSVEQPGCLQASVLLPLNVFAQFACSDASTRIRLNLSLLLDCLNIFSTTSASERSATPVRLTYDGVGHPLVLRFQEQDAETECKLNTIDNEYMDRMQTDFQFSRLKVLNLALLQSEVLRDAIAELSYDGATTAELRLAPTAPRFRFQSPAAAYRIVEREGGRRGQASRSETRTGKRRRSHSLDDEDDPDEDADERLSGDEGDDIERGYEYEEAQCAIELPDPEDRSLSVFSEFRSVRPQTSSYRLELLGRCEKALSMSETCKVQMNENGMLSLICRMRPGMASSAAAAANDRRPLAASSDHCFTEFLIVADEIGEDG